MPTTGMPVEADHALVRLFLATISSDPDDAPNAYRHTPVPQGPADGVRALVIPDDHEQEIQELLLPLDEDASCYTEVRRLVGGLVQCTAVHEGVDFLSNEEALYCGEMRLNARATYLAHYLKFALAEGRYPGAPKPVGEARDDAMYDAMAWQQSVRLVGPVVVVGERRGEWVSVAESFLVFAEMALSVGPEPFEDADPADGGVESDDCE